MKFILLLMSMTLGVTGQLLLKKGVLASSLEPNLSAVVKTIFSPLVFSGFVFYGLSAVIWLFVLQRFPLSIAYPSLALTYAIIVLFSFLFVNEPITTNKIVGIVFIFSGVFFLYR